MLYLLPLFIGLTLAVRQTVLSNAGADANFFDIYQSDLSPHHSLRIKAQNSTLCNTTVNQYTGWLDNGHKHLFFWYFESEDQQSSPSTFSNKNKNPLMLWLNGGPGASSLLGLFQELGPCLINKGGTGTIYNHYGWNKDTALLFVDQPVGVGFSYYDGELENEQPSDSWASAEDMYIFLQMFITQVFPTHQYGPLFLAGESYGGHYVPTLGAKIIYKNSIYPDRPQLYLKSIAIGNPFVSWSDTVFGYWETLCTANLGVPEPVFNATRCDFMAENLPRCIKVAQTCLKHPDPAICSAATAVCWEGVTSLYDGDASRNRFDITRPCETPVTCYILSDWITDYLNLPSTRSALGVPSNVQNFTIISWEVTDRFSNTTDIPMSTEPAVRYLLENQIDVLVYSGNLDLACNTAGSKRWMHAMAWKGQAEFTATNLTPWTGLVNGKKVKAGDFKEVRIRVRKEDLKETRFALVTVDEAGHMVPQDQPQLALDMITRWLSGSSFV